MAEDRIDPAAEIPEADLLEQQAPLDPQSLSDAAHGRPSLESPTEPVDEADRLEQEAPVLGADDDDYPHEPAGAG